ncbi:MAG: DUF4348 domain-containing protein [Bacteroidaceae bacterium]
MKHSILGAAIMLSLTACNGTDKQSDNDDERRGGNDSLTLLASQYKRATPTKTDALFDDFIYNFATDSVMQMGRTQFPLTVRKQGKLSTIDCHNWSTDPLFSEQQVYSIICNNESELESHTRTDLTQAAFERIDLQHSLIKRYLFRHNKLGAWIFTGIDETPLSASGNGEFLAFYKNFATNKAFRKKHIKSTITFVTNFDDGNDGFSTETFEIEAAQWIAWNVNLPTTELTNIIYGAFSQAASPIKLFCLKSTDGAFFRTLYFKQKDKDWQLYKYEDTGY